MRKIAVLLAVISLAVVGTVVVAQEGAAPDAKGSGPGTQLIGPTPTQTPGAAVEQKEPVPEVKGSAPEEKGSAPEVKGSAPEKKGSGL